MRFVGRNGAGYVNPNKPLALGLGGDGREPGASSAIAKEDLGYQAPWAVEGLGTGCFFPKVSQVGAAWHPLWLEKKKNQKRLWLAG